MKIYVASSWRNEFQPAVVEALRNEGHEVYDFRNPAPGNNGFAWSELDPDWQKWNNEAYREMLSHPIAEYGFNCDFDGMKWADACVLVMPCGRSAHTEAGWMKGAGKTTIALLIDEHEPELMYKIFDHVAIGINDMLNMVAKIEAEKQKHLCSTST